MTDPKPYSVEEADCITHFAMELAEHATCDRLRATVAALDQVTRERDEARAAHDDLLERARKHTSLHASGCPLCVYEDGVLQVVCAPCNELSEARAEVERLKTELLDTTWQDYADEWQKRARKAEAEVERLRAWQKAVAEGTGYINHAEGQAGYEVADPDTIVAAWKERDEAADDARYWLERAECSVDGFPHCKEGDECRACLVAMVRQGLNREKELQADNERLREALRYAAGAMEHTARTGRPALGGEQNGNSMHVAAAYQKVLAALAGKGGG